MNASNFSITRQEQRASDFGIEFFANGFNRQVIYSVFNDGKLIKQLTSTKTKENLFAIVVICNRSENGIEVLPIEEFIFEVRFSKNADKKIMGRKIILKAS